MTPGNTNRTGLSSFSGRPARSKNSADSQRRDHRLPQVALLASAARFLSHLGLYDVPDQTPRSFNKRELVPKAAFRQNTNAHSGRSRRLCDLPPVQGFLSA